MAVTQNTYLGDGSTVLYSFTFPYLETTDIKVQLNAVNTTAYTFANATTIQFNTAPANGVGIRIYRQTDDTALAAQFYPGSAIRSQDLNDNFTQNLYVTQESNREAANAFTVSEGAINFAITAVSTANGAVTTANAATATANTASSNASAAVSTANTASINASAAVSTANTASTNATAAVNTANSAAADAATAISTANSAVTTANNAVSTANAATTTAGNAVTTANGAVSTANTASTNASNAVTTANAATATAAGAVTTANNAVTTANGAVSTANTALSTANAAAAAVANAILYDTVANVAAIPASPANNDAVEVVDSTGIQSFTPLTGVPVGFVGDAGLSVRLVYDSGASSWIWIQYFPNDPENRYGDAIVTLQGDVTTLQTDVGVLQTDVGTLQTDIGTLQTDVGVLQTDVGTLQTDLGTAQSDILGLDSAKLDATTAASTYAPLANPTFTGTVTIPAGASIDGYLTTATAASTYQTQAGMSNYLPTSSVGTSVQPYNANTALLNVAQTFSALQTFNSGASDSSGSFRVVPANSQASAYTPVSSDTGKYISISSGGVTIPASIFNSGAVFSIYNNSGSSQTITQGSGVTLRQAGTTNTGNRSLAAYGIATVLCVGADTFVITGVGLS